MPCHSAPRILAKPFLATPILATPFLAMLAACAPDNPVEQIPPGMRAVLAVEETAPRGESVSVNDMLDRLRAEADGNRLELSFVGDVSNLNDGQVSEISDFSEGPRSEPPHIIFGIAGAEDRFAALALARRRGLAVEQRLPAALRPAEIVYRPSIAAGTVIIEFQPGTG